MIKKLFFSLALALCVSNAFAQSLPEGWVYLSKVDPSIVQELRYYGSNNFVGRRIDGYQANQCLLRSEAAEALKNVQAELRQSGLSLKVYDCYRPRRAVLDFFRWSQNPDTNRMKQQFFPRQQKGRLFKNGYIARYSTHSVGDTVDLTIINPSIDVKKISRDPSASCRAPYPERRQDKSIDMGTAFDCLDSDAHTNSRSVNTVAYAHRQLLKKLMSRYGFKNYAKEWWHYSLRHPKLKQRSFDFVVS